jgi:hypothetical protein
MCCNAPRGFWVAWGVTSWPRNSTLETPKTHFSPCWPSHSKSCCRCVDGGPQGCRDGDDDIIQIPETPCKSAQHSVHQMVLLRSKDQMVGRENLRGQKKLPLPCQLCALESDGSLCVDPRPPCSKSNMLGGSLAGKCQRRTLPKGGQLPFVFSILSNSLLAATSFPLSNPQNLEAMDGPNVTKWCSLPWVAS